MDNNVADWDVLIIDDEEDSAGVVAHILQFHDAKTRVAHSGTTGLELFDQKKPGLVFLDIQMPQMSGWDMLKAIQERTPLHDVPVVALTALAMDGDRERILDAGFDGYISKPISPLQFIDQIKDILGMREKNVAT